MIDWVLLLVLAAPLVWELINDKKGDVHPNNDWLIRGLIAVGASALVSIIGNKSFLQALVMAFGIFTLFFPYLVNIVHKKEKWWSALSLTAWPDKLPYWAGTPWYGRLLILLIIFGTCFSIYFWEEMMVWNYPYGR